MSRKSFSAYLKNMQWKMTIAAWLIATWASALPPSEALQRLVQGNERYAKDEPLYGNHLSERRKALESGQSPFATILGCADSRIPPEIIFDQGLGDLFVVRVAGNIAGPLELDSIGYSVKNLGSTLILVLGHASCGAVLATREGKTSDIKAIADLIEPAIQNTKNLEEAIKANVRATVAFLKKSELLQQLISSKKVDCIGAYYYLDTGRIEILQ